MFSKWLLVAMLALETHFAASYLVPLDARSRAEFGGLLGWFWPWAYGDGGLLGAITPEGGFPISGFYLAAVAGATLLLAALAAAGIWVPSAWWRPLAVAGGVLLLALMLLFIGPTKLIPAACALATLYIAMARPNIFATG
jgi:hypothetical protein